MTDILTDSTLGASASMGESAIRSSAAEQERNEREQLEVIAALADDYALVCLIDVETNVEHIFKFDESRRGMLPGWDDIGNFTERLDYFRENLVHPLDRAFFHEATRKQLILDEVYAHGRYSVTYRNRFQGDVTYWRAQFTLTRLSSMQIVAAFSEITEQVLVDMARSAELEKQLSIIRGLSEEYINVCYLNLRTGAVENIALGDVAKHDVGEIIQENTDLRKAYSSFVGQLVHPDYWEEMRPLLDVDYVRELLKDKKEHRVVYRRLFDDGYKWAEVTLVKAERAEEEPVNVAIGFTEIDERYKAQLAKEQIRKEYEAELVEARNRAEDASNAKSRFLFSMSHDIRTPMNAITGYTAIAKRHSDDHDKVLDCLDKIDRAGANLLELVDQVLEMSRIESGRVTLIEGPADVVERAQEMVSLIAQTAGEKGVGLVSSVGYLENRKVYADGGRMNQIVMNILGNAVKYTPEGGSVRFTVSQVPTEAVEAVEAAEGAPAADVDSATEQSDRTSVEYGHPVAMPGYGIFVFTVEDDGIGMSREFLETIFEPFTRESTATVSRIEGTGLGMSIVKRLLDFMNGGIRVESESGRGTKVTVSIPLRLREDDEPIIVASEAVEGASLLRGRRALLVEDNWMNREIAVEILSDCGLLMEVAEDGDTAVEKMQALAARHEFDYYSFILMDIQMPRMSGYDATRAIRQLEAPEGTHVPIIAISANAFEEDKINALASGMDEHLAKPIDIPKLIATLVSFL